MEQLSQLGFDTLKELVEFIKTASPAIWNALLRKQRVDALTGILWMVFLGIVMYFLWNLHKKSVEDVTAEWEEYGEAYTRWRGDSGRSGSRYYSPSKPNLDSELTTKWCAIVFGGIALAIFVGILVFVCRRFLATDYYAIKELFSLLK